MKVCCTIFIWLWLKLDWLAPFEAELLLDELLLDWFADVALLRLPNRDSARDKTAAKLLHNWLF